MKNDRRSEAQRWVVKLGSRVLVPEAGLDELFLQDLARQVAALRALGHELVIVTSGAIATGLALLALKERPRSIAKKQAIAAVGQIALMGAYRTAFGREGLAVAQILLTHEDFRDRRRVLNARHTLHALLEMGIVPLVNENDTVASEEIKVGDNDNLAAMVACLWAADRLVLLSDIDGLYTSDPGSDPDAEFIPVVEELDEEIEAFAAPTDDPFAVGGMRTKLEAAKRAAGLLIPTIIARGREPDVLIKLSRGGRIGTLIRPKQRRLPARKHWIAYTLKPQGSLRVDAGAVRALIEQGTSLLPSGIVGVEGDFQVGDAVLITNMDGIPIAQGLVAYGAREIEKIKGRRSDDIETILGYKYRDEVVHRDDLVLLGSGKQGETRDE
jgi:glutamate 5-kinase